MKIKLNKNNNNFCPCGSQSLYLDCCELFLSGEKIPKTAEQLMRSRYSAYVKNNLGYIQKTMIGEVLEDFNPNETQAWLEGIKWQGLRVLKKYPDLQDPNKSYVSFSAIYKSAGKLFEIQETSEFTKQEDQWFYSGEVNSCGDSCEHEH